MEWEKPTPLQTEDLHGCGGGGDGDGMFVKVMTDEQMGILQKQIAAYAAISEQLVELHKSLTSQNDLAGMRLGNMYGGDPLVPLGTHKITGRQRWTPTPTQLQILEHTFNQEGSIGKPKIPEITGKLLQYGQISETNVYNWFQNRRARSKRKQQAAAPLENAESEVGTDAESPNEKTKTQNFQSPRILTEELNSQDHQASDKPEPVMPPQGGSIGQLPFFAID